MIRGPSKRLQDLRLHADTLFAFIRVYLRFKILALTGQAVAWRRRTDLKMRLPYEGT
jgi:hypothetical protein